MVRATVRIRVGVVIALLAGCGGGGGDGGTTFVATPASLSFTAKQGDPVPVSKSLHIHMNDPQLVYGSGWAGTSPTWITETTFAMIDFSSHPSDWDHVYRIATTNLTPGVYTATLELRTSKPSTTWPPPLVEMKTVQVTYTVTAP